MGKKKIIFMSADFGSGHHSAVSALEQALDRYYPDQYEYEIIDVSALIGPYIDKIAEIFYKGMTTYAKLSYKMFFTLSDRDNSMDSDLLYYQLLKPSFEVIKNEKPDLIIHCFPLLFASIKKYLVSNKMDVPTMALITDTGDVHINWVSKYIDHYLSPTKDTGFYLEEKGVKPETINYLGFPLRQQFYQRYNKREIKLKYNIPLDKKVVLFFPGAWGAGRIKRKVDELEKKLKDAVVVVICGKNRMLKSRLKYGNYKRNRIMPLGYQKHPAELIEISDVVIAKAGGISVMEIVTMKKPLIVTEIFPGQEEPNARFIESMGFGYVEKDPEKMAQKVKYILETDDYLRIKENYDRYDLNDHSDEKIAKFIHKVLSRKK